MKKITRTFKCTEVKLEDGETRKFYEGIHDGYDILDYVSGRKCTMRKFSEKFEMPLYVFIENADVVGEEE